MIPDWAYRRAYNRGAAIPDPVTFDKGVLVATSKQVRERMLCEACEVRLAILDRYAAGLAYQVDGSTPLRELLGYRRDRSHQLVSASLLQTDTLVRFAVSVVWRAHAAESVPNVSLGPYGETLGGFLLERCDLPKNVSVTMSFLHDDGHYVRRKRLLEQAIIVPQTNRRGGNRVHWFMVGGMWFEVVVGSARDGRSLTHPCLHRAPQKVVLVRDVYESGMFESLRAVMCNATPKGKWARYLASLR